MFTFKRIIDEQEQQRVAAKIAEVEQQTCAEIVAVLAEKSDDYHYIPLLWAAFTAISASVLAVLIYPLSADEIVIGQLILFIVSALLFKIPLLQIRLIPKSVRYWRAGNMAKRQFLENNLHHTNEKTGFLIFVSEAEQYIEIIADHGISAKIDDSHWQQIIQDFTQHIKNNQTLEGFIQCVEQCGQLLATYLPADGHDNPDELPNRLILI